ncbi:lytic transglycosylase domain-containing protein [Halobacteriovorax marinus]|uniref:lytic transglycosylase domain-containing protein n=1 Tax=Halobacteriovorax marinus TaxID=97084 RepID=UPI003A94866D
MFKNSLKEYSFMEETFLLFRRLVTSSRARSFVRYANTLAIFIILGLIFSKEATLDSRLHPVLSNESKGESTYFLDEKTYYQFPKVKRTFGKASVVDLQYLSKKESRRLILDSVKSPRLRKRLARYLTRTLELCEKYQVDPFWALSIMWTESHFNLKAKSSVSATGLMQIMPATGVFLSKLLNMPIKEKVIYKSIQDPDLNIEMGVFYLKRLLKMFKGNYRLATVAYNMGPGGVYRRLRNNQPVGVRNLYLDKVRRHYKLISKNFTHNISRSYLALRSTLVVRNPISGYTYSQIAEIDNFLEFLEMPSLDYRIALSSASQSQKSL